MVDDDYREFIRQEFKQQSDSSVNAAIHYKALAKKHGIPGVLIDLLIAECEDRNWTYDLFMKVAKGSKIEFWKKASNVCSGNVFHLRKLHWILCQAGNDVYQNHICSDSKARKDGIVSSINALEKQLLREPDALQMNLSLIHI